MSCGSLTWVKVPLLQRDFQEKTTKDKWSAKMAANSKVLNKILKRPQIMFKSQNVFHRGFKSWAVYKTKITCMNQF